MKAVKFSSFDEALAAFSLGPVRFVCSVCGGVHGSESALRCFSRFYGFCGFCPGCAGPEIPLLRDVFGKDPYAYPFASMPVPKPLGPALSRVLCLKNDFFYETPGPVRAAVLASPSPEREFCRLFRERQRKVREALVAMPEYRGYLELLSWLRSLEDPLSVVEVSTRRPPFTPPGWLVASFAFKELLPGLSVERSWEVAPDYWARDVLFYAGLWRSRSEERLAVRELRVAGGLAFFNLDIGGDSYRLGVDSSRRVAFRKGGAR